jgi:hypothetical protein
MKSYSDWAIPCLPINLWSYPNYEIERIRQMILLPTIQTFSGRYISFVDFSQNEYDVVDIAHSLSNLCRFNGHCTQFYSVAQHCVLASYVVPEEYAFEALMHDRTEAYLGDMASPLKNLMPEFKALERSMEADSAKFFNLPYDISPIVKDADYRMLITEKRDIMVDTPGRVEWDGFSNYPPLEETITPWTPHSSKNMFLARFRELIGEHCLRHGMENIWEKV